MSGLLTSLAGGRGGRSVAPSQVRGSARQTATDGTRTMPSEATSRVGVAIDEESASLPKAQVNVHPRKRFDVGGLVQTSDIHRF